MANVQMQRILTGRVLLGIKGLERRDEAVTDRRGYPPRQPRSRGRSQEDRKQDRRTIERDARKERQGLVTGPETTDGNRGRREEVERLRKCEYNCSWNDDATLQ